MNILKLGFIETKSDWCHTPRWNMKLKSITQIEGCIIHRELQVVNEVCDYLYQNITEWPSLISHSFQWYQYFLCLFAFFIFYTPFHLYLSPALYYNFGRLLQKETFERTCLRLPHKGTFTVIIDSLLPAEWLNTQIKAWAFSGGLWNRLNIPSH